MSDFPPPPPPPGGPPSWGPQPQPGYGAPNQGWSQPLPPSSSGSDHPDGTKALVIALLSLVCCSPLAIWSLILSNRARSEGSTDSKITAAFIISCVSLALLALSLLGVATGVIDLGTTAR